MALVRTGKCVRCGACCSGFSYSLSTDQDSVGEFEDFLRALALRSRVTVSRGSDRFRADVFLSHPCELLRYKSVSGTITYHSKPEGEDVLAFCEAYKDRPEYCRLYPKEPSAMCVGFKFVPETEVRGE